MANGPPPSSAGPSQNAQLPAQASNYYPSQGRTPQQPEYQQQQQQQLHSANFNNSGQAQPFFNANYQNAGWQQNGWHVSPYQYSPGPAPYQQQQQQQHYSQLPYQAFPTQPQPSHRRNSKSPSHTQSQGRGKQKQPPKPRSPSPSPPLPEFHRHWDAVIASFLSALGLHQALKGFENDMLVMNEDWERKKVPKAIGELMRDLMSLGQSPNIDRKERSHDERKIDYLHIAKGTEPRPQSSINKSISDFLAQNRARNDASNRAEFLQSITEKRRRLNPDADDTISTSGFETPSCARTDAKPLNRDVQMKYDIAKNEEGPLRRTVKANVASEPTPDPKGKRKHTAMDDNSVSRERHPGLDERLVNVETHLAIRYVPSPPQSLLDRLKFLEDHIIQLEKEYPPWAALHFNQPHRGWPAPPRPTPIIVPSHLTSTSAQPAAVTSTSGLAQISSKAKNPKSSLQRAVLEKLEVQKAMSDLAGRGKGNAHDKG